MKMDQPKIEKMKSLLYPKNNAEQQSWFLLDLKNIDYLPSIPLEFV